MADDSLMGNEPVTSDHLPVEELDQALQAAAVQVGGTPRPGQVQMAHAVARTLATGQHSLIQAGTGTGKSLAYLVPALMHARDHGSVVVATATLALQRQLIDRDIPAVVDAMAPTWPRPIRAAVLKGRHHYLCRLRLEGGAKSTDTDPADAPALFEQPLTGRLEQQAAQVRAWSQETTTGDRDDLLQPVDSRVWRAVSATSAECIGRSRCSFGDECFAEQARGAARSADLIVTNHAMLALELVEGLPVLPEHDGIIIDEGHEWIDRATSASTITLTLGRAEQVHGSLAKIDARKSEALSASLDDLAGALTGLLGRASGDSDSLRLRSLPPGLVEAARATGAAARAAAVALASPDESERDLAAHARIRSVLDEIYLATDRLLMESSSDVVWVTARPLAVHIAPLSISHLMRSRESQVPMVITSATLGREPFAELARDLGIDDIPHMAMDVGSPFDFARQGILYVPRHVPEPGRQGIDEAVLDEMAELIEAAGGRTLLLLSSWRAVERAADYLRVRLDSTFDLLVHSRGDAVPALVERFRSDPESVLIGTVSLWQGVDVPGDACTLVIIERIPFTRPDDPVMSARIEAVDREGGSGFREIAVPRAATLLAQGVGRLIRGSQDRGVVAVCDPRLITKGYGSTLRHMLPPLWMTSDADQVRAALRRLDESARLVGESRDAGATADAKR